MHPSDFVNYVGQQDDTAFNHALSKALDGGKESLSFYTGRVAEDIRLSPHGAKVLKENCLRCHTEARVNEDRNCWGKSEVPERDPGRSRKVS